MMTKTYEELIEIPDFDDRIRYLQDAKYVGDTTFGGHRYLNQMLYHSYGWRDARRQAILRDLGLDLAHPQFPINGNVYVHHINPITIDDILEHRHLVFDLNNLVCCSRATHNVLHYGRDIDQRKIVTRKPNDTCPWR